MDRLPRDIASERRHSDIVRLLDEHVPHSPQMMGGMPHNSSSSLIGTFSYIGTTDRIARKFYPSNSVLYSFAGSPHHLMSHSTLLGSTKLTNKSKKRPKSSVGGNSPSSPPDAETPQTLRRKTSAKKIPKKQALENHDNTLLGLDAANLYGSSALPQITPYEDCMKNAVSLQNLGIDFQQPYTFPVFHEPSPPHSVTFSPPAKARPSLPTSPTHIAAMRTATQQKHPSMHYTDPFNLNTNTQSNPTYQQTSTQQQQQQQPQQSSQYYHHFLTPPSEPSERNSFPTPSPESSPYYWSSSSPHSNSDWSEGILSPNSSSQGNKQSEAIFI